MQRRLSRSEIRVIHLGAVTIFVSILVFSVTSNTLLMPALRSSHYKKAICTVVSRNMIRSACSCQAGTDCFISSKDCSQATYANYPCMQIIVQYSETTDNLKQLKNGNKSKGESTRSFSSETSKYSRLRSWIVLERGPRQDQREDESPDQRRAMLHMTDLDILYGDRCSFHPQCTRGTNMIREVNTFHHKVRLLGSRFSCLYDPRSPADAVMYITFTSWSIFHSIFWPFLLLLLGIFIICIVYCCIAKLKDNLVNPEARQILHKNSTDDKRHRFTGNSSASKRQTQTKIGLGGRVHV